MQFKTAVLAILTASFPLITTAETAEYVGQVSNLYIDKTSKIKIGVVADEESPLACKSDENSAWQLYFDTNQSYSSTWFEVLNIARRTQEQIKIGYTPSETANCGIEYLAIVQGNGQGGDVDVPTDAITRTGAYGNIAINGNNGLDYSSYSASDIYGSDEAYAAFDGHTFDQEISEGIGTKEQRGIWMVKKDKTANNKTQYWLQVEFNDLVKVSGFRILINAKAANLGRGVKDIVVQGSADGDNFVDLVNFKFSKTTDQRANLPSKTDLRVFRILVESNWGDDFIEIDELEVYAN